jgi:protein SCO1/2
MIEQIGRLGAVGALWLWWAGCAGPISAPQGEPRTGDAAGEGAEVAPGGAVGTPISPGSLYALEAPMRTQAGEGGSLNIAAGHPAILSMFYTSCPMACPLLIEDIRAIEAALPAESRARLRVVLVSLDPARDDTAALAEVAARHGLDERWTLGAVPEGSVREVAALLGVRYRQTSDGGFAHTSVLTLVDGEGRVVARSEGEEGRAALVAALSDHMGE